MKKPLILVPIFHSLVSKNILNTDALGLIEKSGKYQIVLIVPKVKYDFFVKFYKTENTLIESFDVNTFVNTPFEKLMHTISMLLIDTHYLHYKRKELFEANPSLWGHFKHFIRELIVKIAAGKKWAIFIFRFIDQFFSSKSVYKNIFDKYKPDLVFSTDLFEQMSGQLLREAQFRRIRTIGMVRSWDNCLSKGILRHFADTYITNNAVLKDELTSIHGIEPEKIEVTGLPQFDSFINLKPEPRDSFFQQHGLDPSKKLILFAPAGSVLSDSDKDICEILINAQKSSDIGQNIQIFVRNHPQHPAIFSGLEKYPNLFIQNPGEVLDPSTHKETEMTPKDLDFLRNILAHTDVLIWVATTLCLDAIMYDIPQIVLNFDGYKEKDYYHSVKKYHDEAHMKKMFVLEPFRIANSKDELIENLNLYLGDRNIDKEAREKVRQQQLYSMDGKAGERIAKLIQESVKFV